MKKIFFTFFGLIYFLVSCALSCKSGNYAPSYDGVPDIHNARTSVNWGGVYSGAIPAAGGGDIKVRLFLSYDDAFELQYHYIGKTENVFIARGTFTWSDDGSVINLGLEGVPSYYFVSAGYLIQYDMEGKRITGSFAERYVLKKE